MKDRRAAALAGMILFSLVSSTPAEEFVRIGTWNIQNLGQRPWGQHPKALAQHIQLAGVDVLALQEIHDTDNDPARRTNGKLDSVMELLNEGGDQDWTYVLFSKRTADDTARHCGVAWNRKRVRRRGEPFKIPVKFPHEHTWRRQPHAMKFAAKREGGSDFVLISIHMKSNLPVRGAPSPVLLRKLEAQSLVEQLGRVKQHFSDQDIIILGDTNCLASQEAALGLYTQAGLLDLNRRDAPTYKNGTSPLDRILVSSGQSEFKYARQYVLTPADADLHTSKFSDHFLTLAAIRVMPDDD